MTKLIHIFVAFLFAFCLFQLVQIKLLERDTSQLKEYAAIVEAESRETTGLYHARFQQVA